MSKPKETYKATYRAGAARIRKELLPERLPYMEPGWVIDSMEMRAAGAMSDGREFQDVRIYLQEGNASTKMRHDTDADPGALSGDGVLALLRNTGVDTDCGACVEIAYTGMTTAEHTCADDPIAPEEGAPV